MAEFFTALKTIHVGRRATQVHDVSFEIGTFRELQGFREYRLRAAPLDGTPLVHGDGAKVTLAVTTAMGVNGKLDGFQGSGQANEL